MSIEAVIQFSRLAEDDLEIQQSLEATTEPKSLIDLAVELGSERGFSFTSNDLEQYYDEESRNVQGFTPRNAVFLATSRSVNTPDPGVCDGLPFLARQMCLKLNS